MKNTVLRLKSTAASLSLRGSVVATAVLLAGCSVLTADKIDTYVLPSAQPVQSASVFASSAEHKPALSLRINRPSASEKIGGQRMVVLPQPEQMQVYQGVRWSEPTPILLRNRLFDAFSHASAASLSTDERNLHADYELVSDLRAFQSEYRANGHAPQAVITLDMQLVRTNDRRIIASKRFHVAQAAEGADVVQVVRAFGKSADALAQQIVDWSLPQMQADAAAK